MATRTELGRGWANRADVTHQWRVFGGSTRASAEGHATQKSVHTKPPWLPKTTPTLAFLACLLTLYSSTIIFQLFNFQTTPPPTIFYFPPFPSSQLVFSLRQCQRLWTTMSFPFVISSNTCLQYCVHGVQVDLQETDGWSVKAAVDRGEFKKKKVKILHEFTV